jgi:hypothetical protein
MVNRRGNHKVEVICPICSKSFFVAPYRIRNKPNGLQITCSYKCAGVLRIKTHGNPTSIDPEIIKYVEEEYRFGYKKVHKIADEFNISRNTILRYSKLNNWKREYKSESNRLIYRKVASEKIGRPLKKDEHVHHIDLDNKNCEMDNLHVFKNSTTHSMAHKSLERCGLYFFKTGLVIFNNISGLYEINYETT